MRKILGLASVLLLAGCHSAQVVMQSPKAAAEPVAAAAPVPLDSTLTARVVATRPVTPVATPAAGRRAVAARRVPLAPRQATGLPSFSRLATAGLATPVAKQLAHRMQRRRPTEGAAENGLGRVALFFIGVVLAVLAGLAALVNVIFGVGFFTALGYTAAGLVVLFLLYSLFSGGKKKK